jgi:DNA repair exonuclease SbcCD nuclease subunit
VGAPQASVPCSHAPAAHLGWHLGRSFHGASLQEEQAAAIERIAELARDYAVDAVLIAGDLYDSRFLKPFKPLVRAQGLARKET